MIIDHWDVEDLRFRILSGSSFADGFLTEDSAIIDEMNKEYWEGRSGDIPSWISHGSSYGGSCWIWNGANDGKQHLTNGGYGRISYRNKTCQVHRVSFVLWNGKLTPKKHVDHICNNRLCCNPNHLAAVTNLQNQRLKIKRMQNA